MTSSTSLFNQQMRESINPFSAINMINRNLMNEAVKRQFKENSDSYISSNYSTHTKKQSPDTPVSRALEKKFAERRKELYRSLNANSSFNFAELIKTCLSWR